MISVAFNIKVVGAIAMFDDDMPNASANSYLIKIRKTINTHHIYYIDALSANNLKRL